ncbi:Glyoxalase/bleomycin resistance protein/dioxygenase [Chthoniobacter flavus Ellin428]|uniref:Glyoxalase/bleomycin resistance protein/dioxygenase n=1 Tax=Chthoniobacter flavus Ellin428 TaxID=497964 RepID=B4D3V7_9BACT|nr:VOC family protein [Chthoniobacter flavus]EDY18937.1 Glyoxalase/bleomycin resistance protein/dioxygenase [Chthoniobacter flavus Ellin428]TCO93522.1 putative enzyme related to lactoylglutathione lyase [Chthoniobacter flavus]
MTFSEVAVTNYPATDLAASRAFYEKVLGLKPSRVIAMDAEHGWIEYEVGQHTFGVGKMPGWISSPNCALETDDLNAAVAALKKAGTPFHKEPFETPVCRMAMVMDPGGTVLTIHQRKPRASVQTLLT